MIRTGSLEEKRFWPKREVGNEWCLWDGGRQGVLTGQGFYQSHSVPLMLSIHRSQGEY